MLELRAMTPSDPFLSDADALYLSAFPEIERIPLESIHRGMTLSDVDYNAVLDDGEFVGLAYTMTTDHLIYLIYFAIEPGCRSKGYGGRVMEMLKGMAPENRVFLNIEPVLEGSDNYEQRVSRRSFYERHGLREFMVITAPDGNDFMTMISGRDLTEDEVLGIYARDSFRKMFCE
ncbi:MAG: GNAT family N-acetyltransferase [Candidatus Methanomethylophilaceae archaeon]